MVLGGGSLWCRRSRPCCRHILTQCPKPAVPVLVRVLP